MGEWRKGWHSYNQKDGLWPTRKTKNGKPPPSPGSWQPVPHWEKKFCTFVCSIPWKKLCETKKLMYMYPNVVEWNDSAGEEAFYNAKARYWTKINHLPCHIPLPDPDMYIDVVDQNAFLDPELVEDLYKQPPPSEDGERDASIDWPSFLFTNETVPVSGWGDEEDVSTPIQPAGWGDAEDLIPTNDAADQSIQIQRTGWGHEEDLTSTIDATDKSIPIQPTGWDEAEDPVPTNTTAEAQSVTCIYGDSRLSGRDNSWEHQEYRNNEQERRYGRKRDGGGCVGSRCTDGRYQGGDHYRNNNWRYIRGRKNANYLQGSGNTMSSCGPTNYQGSTDSHGAWKWQKSVSS